MTYWTDDFKKIKTELIKRLEELEDDYDDPVFEHIYFGRKASPEVFPCVIIWPLLIRPVPTTLKSSSYPMSFQIIVIGKTAEIEGGYDDVMDRLGRVEKMLVDDRQFKNDDGVSLASNLEVTEITPDVYRPRVRTRHETDLTVRFDRFYLPV